MGLESWIPSPSTVLGGLKDVLVGAGSAVGQVITSPETPKLIGQIVALNAQQAEQKRQADIRNAQVRLEIAKNQAQIDVLSKYPQIAFGALAPNDPAGYLNGYYNGARDPVYYPGATMPPPAAGAAGTQDDGAMILLLAAAAFLALS